MTATIKRDAAELQTILRNQMQHDQICVKTYGIHWLIMLRDEEAESIIARLTQRGTDYIASFRTHTVRWEPLPGEGDISTMSAVVIDLLEPYLTL